MKAVTGGVPVELRAGDGVIYSNFLIHWGSDYTTKLRRTLHGGHAIFGHYPELGFTESLAPWARERFAGWDRRSARMQDLTAATLRAGHRARCGGVPCRPGGPPTGCRRERQDGADDLPGQGGYPPAYPENP